MNACTLEIPPARAGLALELRFGDGTSTEDYQVDKECVRKTLRLLSTPRLLAHPQLVLPSNGGATVIPCRLIDMILARTSAPTRQIFPLIFPAGLLDIIEAPSDDALSIESHHSAGSLPLSPFSSRVEIRTVGGWVVTLNVLTMVRETVQDERPLCERLFDLPAIPFRLQNGGIGLVNPHNITRANGHPAPGALTGTALAMESHSRTSIPSGIRDHSPSPFHQRK